MATCLRHLVVDQSSTILRTSNRCAWHKTFDGSRRSMTQGELAGMREALTEAGARAEAAEARASEENAKTAQAIAGFETIARRLEVMPETKRSWWRWLRFAD
jgi:hypothetical protein